MSVRINASISLIPLLLLAGCQASEPVVEETAETPQPAAETLPFDGRFSPSPCQDGVDEVVGLVAVGDQFLLIQKVATSPNQESSPAPDLGMRRWEAELALCLTMIDPTTGETAVIETPTDKWWTSLPDRVFPSSATKSVAFSTLPSFTDIAQNFGQPSKTLRVDVATKTVTLEDAAAGYLVTRAEYVDGGITTTHEATSANSARYVDVPPEFREFYPVDLFWTVTTMSLEGPRESREVFVSEYPAQSRVHFRNSDQGPLLVVVHGDYVDGWVPENGEPTLKFREEMNSRDFVTRNPSADGSLILGVVEPPPDGGEEVSLVLYDLADSIEVWSTPFTDNTWWRLGPGLRIVNDPLPDGSWPVIFPGDRWDEVANPDAMYPETAELWIVSPEGGILSQTPLCDVAGQGVSEVTTEFDPLFYAKKFHRIASVDVNDSGIAAVWCEVVEAQETGIDSAPLSLTTVDRYVLFRPLAGGR